MAKAIYLSAINLRTAEFCNSNETGWGGLSNQYRPDKLKKALALCYIDLSNVTIDFWGYNGYYVECPPDQCNEIFRFYRELQAGRVRSRSMPAVTASGSDVELS